MCVCVCVYACVCVCVCVYTCVCVWLVVYSNVFVWCSFATTSVLHVQLIYLYLFEFFHMRTGCSRDATALYMWRDACSSMWHDATHVLLCDMTWCMFFYVTCLPCICDVTYVMTYTNKHVSFTGLFSCIYRSLLTHVALYTPWFCDVTHVCVWHDSCTYVTQSPRCCENRVRLFEKTDALSSQIGAPCSHNHTGSASHIRRGHVTHTGCVHLRRECVYESICVTL